MEPTSNNWGWRGRLAAAPVLAVALSACGSSPGSSLADPANGCKAYYAAVTARYSACTQSPQEFIVSPQTIDYYCGQMAAEVKSGALAYDQTKVSACENEVAALPCAQITLDQWPTPSCAQLFVGTHTDGQSCPLGIECVSGVCGQSVALPSETCTAMCLQAIPAGGSCGSTPGAACAQATYCSTGSNRVCTTYPVGGQPCADYCAYGFYCDMALGMCQPRQASGSCTDNGQCAVGTYCLYPSASASSGTCTAYLPAGSACAASYQCAHGTYCTGGKCTAWPVGTGGACGLIDGQQVPCIDALCGAPYDTSAGMFTGAGTCQAQSVPGGACHPNDPDDCQAGYYCFPNTSNPDIGNCAPDCM